MALSKWCKKTDPLWSEIVRLKNHGRCIVCHKPAAQAHHLIPRSHKAHRHSLMNGVPLCAGCHEYAETHPRKFTAWLKLTFPALWRWVQRHRQEIVRYPDYHASYKRLKAILDDFPEPGDFPEQENDAARTPLDGDTDGDKDQIPPGL